MTGIPLAQPRWRTAGWTLVLPLALALMFWVLVAFGDTVMSAVNIWLTSETYAHGLLVVPISAYLIWRDRADVAGLTARPNLLGLIAFAGAGGIWWFGRLAEVDAAQQFAVVFMLLAGAWALLGSAIVRRLWFPLLFLVFAVPFGEFLLPPLMNFTADFTVGALRLVGMPVFREGNMLTIPSGRWSVVEACSGLRYLIASLTLGCLYAYLSYRKTWKRLAFIALSIVAPILANGVRAFLIVMIGHLSNNRLAVGVDHLIYGWIFFGLVMMLMFWIGSLWRDASDVTSAGLSSTAPPPGVTSIGVPLMAVILAFTATAWATYAEKLSTSYITSPVHLSTPLPAGDWRLAENVATDWMPQFRFSRAELAKTYFKADRTVTLVIKYYRRQKQGMEMINIANEITGTRVLWRRAGDASQDIVTPKKSWRVDETVLVRDGDRLLAWHWFDVDGTPTASRPIAKLLQAKTRVREGSDDTAAIFLVTPTGEQVGQARATLQDFVSQMSPSIDETLRRAKP